MELGCSEWEYFGHHRAVSDLLCLKLVLKGEGVNAEGTICLIFQYRILVMLALGLSNMSNNASYAWTWWNTNVIFSISRDHDQKNGLFEASGPDMANLK